MIEPFEENHPGAELVPLVAKLNEVIEAVNRMQELIERLSRHDLDDAPECVEAGLGAIRPARTRLKLERGHPESRDVIGERFGGLSDDGRLPRVGVAHRAATVPQRVRPATVNSTTLA